jgi:hypothetical protein
MRAILTVSAMAMFAGMLSAGHGQLVSEAGAAADTIRCTSQDDGYTECPTYTRGVVRLSRRLSDAACLEGRSWGVDNARGVIWVDRGCRADFTVESRFGGGVGGNGGFGQTPDNMRTFRNGETEITMSRNCVIAYDPNGYRIRSDRGCSGDDITRADQQYAAYGGPGGNADGFGGNRGFRRGPDNIRTFRNGDTEVTVSSACVATYDARGYRINNGRCSGDDITRADQQYADYRALIGNNRGAGRMPDNMRTFRNGETEITMSRNCIMTYDARGYRIRSDRGCSGDDITRSDQEYAAYSRR